MKKEDVLNTSFTKLDLTTDFCRQCAEMGLGTIDEVLKIPLEELVNKAGFSYGWLAELSDYLERKGLTYLLQPIPGRKTD